MKWEIKRNNEEKRGILKPDVDSINLKNFETVSFAFEGFCRLQGLFLGGIVPDGDPVLTVQVLQDGGYFQKL